MILTDASNSLSLALVKCYCEQHTKNVLTSEHHSTNIVLV